MGRLIVFPTTRRAGTARHGEIGGRAALKRLVESLQVIALNQPTALEAIARYANIVAGSAKANKAT